MPSQSPESTAAMASPAIAQPSPGRIRAAFFVGGFATFSLLYCAQPLLPEFAREFHLDAATSSLPVSLATACLALSIFCAGALSENLGRRGLMFGSILCAALLNFAAAWMPQWSALVALRALSGIALGGMPAVAMVYMAEELPPEKLGAATGLYIGGNAFGGMMGRIATGFLTDHFGWRIALASLSAFDLLCAIGFVLLLPASRNFVRRRGADLKYHFGHWSAHLRNKYLLWLFVIPFCDMGAFVSVYNYIGFRLGGAEFGLSQSALALIFGVYVFGIFSSSVSGHLSDRIGRGPVVSLGTVAAFAGVALTMTPWLAAIILGIALLTAGFFVAHSAASAWVSRLGHSSKSHAASLYLLAYYLGSSVLGLASGWCWEHGQWNAVGGFCLLLLAFAAIAARILRKHADDSKPYGRFAPHPPRSE